MNTARHLTRTSLAGLLALALAACGDAGKVTPPQPPFPVAQGIRLDATRSDLLSRGWTACYEGDYATGQSLSTILAGCTGQYMLLGCRASDTTDALALAAADLRALVIQADGTGLTHASNGVGWYFNDSWSWGFFPAGQPVNLDTCDTDSGGVVLTRKAERLCWHTSNGDLTAGFRCGDNDLSADATWRRLVMVHP